MRGARVAGFGFVLATLAGLTSWAQSFPSCLKFFDDRHQAVACAEAVFSQDQYHFTLASVPPSNGFGPGLVLIKKFRNEVGAPARLNAVDLSVTGAVTTNSSWYAGGDLLWALPLDYHPDASETDGMKLGKLRVAEQATVHAAAGYRAARTLYFYGKGSRAPTTRYIYAQDDTSAKVDARFPLTRWLVPTGFFEIRNTTLPGVNDPAAVALQFGPGSLPGLANQPLYLHGGVGLSTTVNHVSENDFAELPTENAVHFQHALIFSFNNDFAYHWQQPADGSTYAFRQFRYDGHQSMELHEVLRNTFPAGAHRLVHYICETKKGENSKKSDECNFGQFDVKTRLILTQTSGSNQIPFYLQPTLGGTDIDSQVTLRGWDNYRFRAQDIALVQFEYGIPVYDPFGVYVFYDAGTVGNTASELAVGRFRQDAGFGLSVRVLGQVVIQTYYAYGAGHGGMWNYNFAKFF
jgi:hypothetical protein